MEGKEELRDEVKTAVDKAVEEGVTIMNDKEKEISAALKVSLAILGVGLVAGATLVIGLDQIMKRIFVSETWPGEEWSNDDWAGEELE